MKSLLGLSFLALSVTLLCGQTATYKPPRFTDGHPI